MNMTYMYDKPCRLWIVPILIVLFSFFVLVYVRPSFADAPVYKETLTRSSVDFFVGNQDIPVMPGLVELEARSFSYDKPEGEITEIVAQMNGVTIDQVIYYYDVTLPQFGWNKVIGVEGGHFYRDKEYLLFSFAAEGDQSFAKIMIRPSR